MQPIVAGLLATGTMSGAMRTAQALGLLRRPPPATITERALRLKPSTVDKKSGLFNAASHFGYGAALALLFAPLQRRSPIRTRIPVNGMAYGLGVWVANYEGLLPALDLMPPAHRDDEKRVGSMIFAHLVYGAMLELLIAKR
jgi:uncharacterized membrane protein YagU involved in acid resistance